MPRSTLVVLALAGSGCLTNTYRIPRSELVRVAATPPEARTELRVTQELTTGVEAPAPALGVHGDIVIVTGQADRDRGRIGGAGGTPRPPASAKNSTAAADAAAAAAAVVVVAGTIAIVAAVTEGIRYDGRVRLHPEHPIHMRSGGGWITVPLSQIDPMLADRTELAVVTPRDGGFAFLGRSPLMREGLTYTMLGGAAQSASAAGDVGAETLFHIQVGYFPQQTVGIQFVTALGWRTNSVGATLYDARYALELDAYPLALGRLHAGVFGSFGLAMRYEDGVVGGDHKGLMLSGGAQAQLEISTFLALTGRVGVVNAHGELTREALIGISVY